MILSKRVKSVTETACPHALTVIGPLDTPAGAVADRVLLFIMLNAAFAPLNKTDVAAKNPLPLIVTLVPVLPEEGLNEVIVTGAIMFIATWFECAGLPDVQVSEESMSHVTTSPLFSADVKYVLLLLPVAFPFTFH
jgi:hypothetical protein